jgi:hypothetical protein
MTEFDPAAYSSEPELIDPEAFPSWIVHEDSGILAILQRMDRGQVWLEQQGSICSRTWFIWFID